MYRTEKGALIIFRNIYVQFYFIFVLTYFFFVFKLTLLGAGFKKHFVFMLSFKYFPKSIAMYVQNNAWPAFKIFIVHSIWSDSAILLWYSLRKTNYYPEIWANISVSTLSKTEVPLTLIHRTLIDANITF